jgi:hypothetical protein
MSKTKVSPRVVTVQQLRRSSAAAPHTNRKPRGSERRIAIAEARESLAHPYLGSPIEGVELYTVTDQYGYLAGPLPWCVASLEASYLCSTMPNSDIEIHADERCKLHGIARCTICLPR